MKNVASLLIGMALSGTTISAEISDTKISRIMMGDQYGKNIFVQVEGTPSRDNSHCHSNSTWDYVLSTDGELGEQMLSIVMAAYAAQKTVTLYGTDTCTNHHTAENLWRIDAY